MSLELPSRPPSRDGGDGCSGAPAGRARHERHWAGPIARVRGGNRGAGKLGRAGRQLGTGRVKEARFTLLLLLELLMAHAQDGEEG
nr:unnamed protein product [Digitaria exilis]